MLNRRQILREAGGVALLAGTGCTLAGLLPRGAGAAADGLDLPAALPAGTREEAILEALPGKAPLIKLSYRPPNYETPVSYFDRSVFTPNEAFFVRYHLADIPEVDAKGWTLKIGGTAGGAPLELTLDTLKQEFEPVELAAACMCSGSRRGLFQPHVPGVQWSNGAIGNARWKGARLRDILDKVGGIGKGAVEVAFDGADGPVLDKTPDFRKSLPVWKALDETVIVAYEMNGAPLPHWNGFPARLVVPGWTATYWVKHLTAIDVLDRPFDGFWMKSAYRIPQGKFPIVERFTSQEFDTATTPITEMVVNSMITAPSMRAKLRAGQPAEVRGVAWDGGYGIQTVEVSTDGGKSWKDAALGQDYGRFSFRPWTFRFTPKAAGRYEAIAKATNRIGQTQTAELIPNPAGYHNNVMSRVAVTVA